MEKELDEISETAKLVRIDEAAKFLNSTVGTIRNIMTDTRGGLNDLPFYKVRGVGIRFNLKELNEWYQAQRKLTPQQLEAKYGDPTIRLMFIA
jgi:hypothetical protein